MQNTKSYHSYCCLKSLSQKRYYSCNIHQTY